MNRGYRSILAQLRTGILPLEIEVGRWSSTAVEERICKLCIANVVEDENHFIFDCEFYHVKRFIIFDLVSSSCTTFRNSTKSQKWKILMSENYVYNFGKFVSEIYSMRREALYVAT